MYDNRHPIAGAPGPGPVLYIITRLYTVYLSSSSYSACCTGRTARAAMHVHVQNKLMNRVLAVLFSRRPGPAGRAPQAEAGLTGRPGPDGRPYDRLDI